MKSVEEFENAAATIWMKNEVQGNEKDEQLQKLAAGIDHYLERCKACLADLPQGQTYNRKFVARAISHLEALARDCRELSASPDIAAPSLGSLQQEIRA